MSIILHHATWLRVRQRQPPDSGHTQSIRSRTLAAVGCLRALAAYMTTRQKICLRAEMNPRTNASL